MKGAKLQVSPFVTTTQMKEC